MRRVIPTAYRIWRANGDPDEIARRAAMVTLIRMGWAQDNPAFRRMFASLFVPGATAEQAEWFSELQRRTISPENAATWQEKGSLIDVSHLLRNVRPPTLVFHAIGDAISPFQGGRQLAADIPGARFVPLDSSNHILLEHEAAFEQFLDELRRFINP
jgi:pimeloyl-ACP methyl ester carboxylesterase